MTDYEIPLKAVPSQTATFTIGDTNYVLSLHELPYYAADGVPLGSRQYASLTTGDELIVAGALLQSAAPVIDADYLNAGAELYVVDESGKNEAPHWSGWGTKWKLIFKNDA